MGHLLYLMFRCDGKFGFLVIFGASKHTLDNGGVEIGSLSALTLHTLGVVNVNGSCGKSIFNELKKLTQLRKL